MGAVHTKGGNKYANKSSKPEKKQPEGPRPLSYFAGKKFSDYHVPEKSDFTPCSDEEFEVAKLGLDKILAKMTWSAAPKDLSALSQSRCSHTTRGHHWFRLRHAQVDAEGKLSNCDVFVLANYNFMKQTEDNKERYTVAEEHTAKANFELSRCVEVKEVGIQTEPEEQQPIVEEEPVVEQKVWRDEDLKVVPFKPSQEQLLAEKLANLKLTIPDSIKRDYSALDFRPTEDVKVWRDEDLKVVPFVQPKTLPDQQHVTFTLPEEIRNQIFNTPVVSNTVDEKDLQIVPYKPLNLAQFQQPQVQEIKPAVVEEIKPAFFGPAKRQIPLKPQKAQASNEDVTNAVSLPEPNNLLGGWRNCNEEKFKMTLEALRDTVDDKIIKDMVIYEQNLPICRMQGGLLNTNIRAIFSFDGQPCAVVYTAPRAGKVVIKEQTATITGFDTCVKVLKA